MRLGVVGSMHFTEDMLRVRDELIRLGHDAFVTGLANPFIGKLDAERDDIKRQQKLTRDAMREFADLMQGADGIVVVNKDRHGIKNYIGANTFGEMFIAHCLRQKIWLLNPSPSFWYIESELEAFRPIIIFGDLTLIQ